MCLMFLPAIYLAIADTFSYCEAGPPGGSGTPALSILPCLTDVIELSV